MSTGNHANNQQFPDLSDYGYNIEQELGNNRAGGRVTYLAMDIKTQQQVVIKDFQFAQSNSSWSGFDSYEHEIKVLQTLEHPNIPHYLNSFETKTGFCLVQEYKPASTLHEFANLTVAEIRIVAVELLKILVYLQSQHPAVIHRDLKPENILIERWADTGQLRVYLVDFGFARLAGDVTASSVVKGTLGFMPPEQIFNRELTCASDLYSLGMTLICLLTRTKSADVANLLDQNYCVDFTRVRDRAPEYFAVWLESMVEPNHNDRFANAAIALSQLTQPIVNHRTISHETQVSWNWVGKITGFTLIGILFGTIFTQVIAKVNQINHYQEVINTVNSTDLIPTPRKITKSSQNVNENIQQLQATRSCQSCNLQGANLQGMDLSGVNLERANLSTANLQATNLRGANLRYTNLHKAKLQNSYLGYANFHNAEMGQASLRSANLENAQLKRANLGYAELEAANLKGANLQGAGLNGANFRYAILRNAAISVERGDSQRFKGAMLPNGTIHP